MSKSGPWYRLRVIDKILVLTLIPIWVVSLILHLDLAVDDLLYRPAIIMSSSETAGGFPVVSQIAAGAEQLVSDSQINIGDELLSINHIDLAGVSGFRASIIAFSLVGEESTITGHFRQGETVVEIGYPFVDLGIPWWWPSLFSIAFGIVGLLVLLSAPESLTARAVFPAFICFALTWLVSFGGSEIQSVLGLIVYGGSMVFAAPLVLKAILLLPEKTAIKSKFVNYGVWIFALMSISGLSAFIGIPLSAATGQAIHLAFIALFYLAILVILARNYLRADKLGRRQLRWVIFGFYLAFLPAMVVTVIIIQYPQQFSLYALSSVGMPIIPIMFLVAITKYQLFDIDKLIGRSVSYSILIVLIAVLTETVIEPLVALTGSRFGFDGNTVQVIFVAMLAAILIPLQKRWRPLVNRIFFAEGIAVEEAIEGLIGRLEKSEGMTETDRFRMLGEALSHIYKFSNWAVFSLDPTSKQPVAIYGSASEIEIDIAFWKKYQRRIRPGTEQLDNNDIHMVAPIRPAGALQWLLVLGPKTSGDVYTPTDIGLIASISHIVAEEILQHESLQVPTSTSSTKLVVG